MANQFWLCVFHMALWQVPHLYQSLYKCCNDSALKRSDWLAGCNVQNMKRGLPMLMFDRERSSRIGVLRKDASSELGIRWFKLPAMYAYHVANAWQMCGSNGWMKIHIFLCVYDDSVCALYPASAGPHQQGSKFCSLLSLNGSHKTPFLTDKCHWLMTVHTTCLIDAW